MLSSLSHACWQSVPSVSPADPRNFPSHMSTDHNSAASGITGIGLFHEQEAKHKLVVDLGIAFHSTSVALNVIATALIAGRLLRQSKIIRDYNVDHGRQYISLVAVFAESGALYTISGLVFIPLYAMNDPLIIVFSVFFGASAVSRQFFLLVLS